MSTIRYTMKYVFIVYFNDVVDVNILLYKFGHT